jgi:tetratricopeptide (TPR) repeat protein
LLVFGVLALGLAGGGVYWRRAHGLDARLAEARDAVGSVRGRELIGRLAEDYSDHAEAQFLSARQLGFDAKYVEAEERLNRAAALGWPRAAVEREKWLRLAHTNFRAAEPFLQELREARPDDREVLLALALGYSRINRLSMADQLLGRVLERHPKDGAALSLRGKLHLQRKERDLAYEDLAQALALGEGQYYYPVTRVLMVVCLRQLGQYESAYEWAVQCRQDEPNNILVLFNLGLSARYLDRPDEALEAFQVVLTRKPHDADTLLEMAHLYDAKGEFKKALAVLKQVEPAYPDDLQLLLQMAKTLQALGDAAGAADYQRRYVETHAHLLKLAAQEKGTAVADRATPPPRPEPVDK